jgi:hypothetical protein
VWFFALEKCVDGTKSDGTNTTGVNEKVSSSTKIERQPHSNGFFVPTLCSVT